MSARSLGRAGRVAAVAAVTLVTGMLPVVMFAGTAAAAAPVSSVVDTPSTHNRRAGELGTANSTVGFTKNVALGPAGTTYTVTSPSLCGGAGTFEQALKDANANPGTDTITFTPGLVVDAYTCTTAAPRPFPFATSATESVDIVGRRVPRRHPARERQAGCGVRLPGIEVVSRGEFANVLVG